MLLAKSLNQLEQVIERGLPTFIEVGEALLAIQEGQLYLEAGYTDFTEYCHKRWHLSATQVKHRLEAALVVQSLDGPAPDYQSHALVLGEITDPDLRNMAWAAARAEYGENLTTDKLEGVVRRYTTITDERLRELVAKQVITASVAADLVELVSRLPGVWQQAINRFGISNDGIVDPDAVRVLRVLEYQFPEDVKDILYSGIVYLNDQEVPLHLLTEPEAVYFSKVLHAAKRQGREQIVAERQRNHLNGSQMLVINEGDFSELIDVPPQSLVAFFPGTLSREQVISLVEASGLDVYMVLAYNQGAKCKFGDEVVEVGSTRVIPPQLQQLLEALKVD